MAKGKRKSRKRAAAEEQDAPVEVGDTSDGKNLLELSADELKKEAFKLGLFVDGDKPRKDQALTKLTPVWRIP